MNNNIKIKSAAQIELMRESGQLLAQVFKQLDGFVAQGKSTLEINDFVEQYIVETLQARPAVTYSLKPESSYHPIPQ